MQTIARVRAVLPALALLCALPARAEEPAPVRIAVVNDQSGVYADVGGRGSVQAAELAAKDFMKRHKGVKVHVVSADHQNKPDVAAREATELFDSGVDAIVDLPNSGAALAVSGIAKQKHRLALVVSAGSTALTNAECNRYTFHYAFDNYMLAHGTGTSITRMGGATWSILYPDYAFGRDLEAQMRAAIQAAGGSLKTASQATPFPSKDFEPFLQRVRDERPNVMGALQAGGDLVQLVRQYNAMGLRHEGIKLGLGLLFENDVRAVGQGELAGASATVPWFSHLDDRALAWAARFEKATGKHPTWAQAGVYSAVTTYLDAVVRAGSSDADKVVAALEGHRFDDFFARNAYVRPQDHRVLLDVYHVEVKNTAMAKDADDLFKLVSRTPGDEAFQPLAQSTCRMGAAQRR